MSYYIYNTSFSGESNSTVIFDFQVAFKPEEIRDELVAFYKTNPRLDLLKYFCPELHSRDGFDYIEELSDIANKDSSEIIVKLYDENGLNDCSNCENIFKQGLLNIVCERGAVICSDNNFHFDLPSGRHSPFLIRTANILSHSKEIQFISLYLLNEISGSKYHQIVCDSSSIIQIAYGLKYLKSLFGVTWDMPINSFYSYRCFADNFVFKPNSLVLISASNSGNLESEILKNGEIDLDIITILLNKKDVNGYQHLLNLNEYKDVVFQELQSTTLYKEDDCKLCSNQSTAVKVHGEQFLPSKVSVKSVLLTRYHKPLWLDKIISCLISQKGLQCFTGETPAKKAREIFMNCEELYKENNFLKGQFNKYVHNHLPSKVDVIIFLPDNGSVFIANELREYYNSFSNKSEVELVGVNDIPYNLEHEDNNVLVVGACITTGNQFNSVSRDLRRFKKSSLHYFTMFSRLSNEYKYNTLKGNLEFRSENKSSCVNKFHCLFKSFLPDVHSLQHHRFNKPNWNEELDFWLNISEPPNFIMDRIRVLEESAGLIDDLFLLNPFNDQKLTLRPNFAFFDFKETPTQALVYYIVCSVLHFSRSLKNKSDKVEILVNHEHVHSLISIDCFNRFNDGVIQAAILRAARPTELDYSCDEEISRSALKILKDRFKNPDQIEDNEGIMEFLLAIGCGKMKLQKVHILELTNYLKNKYTSRGSIVYMLELVEKKYSD